MKTCAKCGNSNLNNSIKCKSCDNDLLNQEEQTNNSENKGIDNKILEQLLALNSKIEKIEARSKQIGRTAIYDINMPFESMVKFMVKWAIASIPAIIILCIMGFFTTAFLPVIFSRF